MRRLSGTPSYMVGPSRQGSRRRSSMLVSASSKMNACGERSATNTWLALAAVGSSTKSSSSPATSWSAVLCMIPSRCMVKAMSVKASPAASNVLRMSAPDSLTLTLE
eukprot:scaffold30042_cov65-Phaeocystis_antarctica.AAC.2